MNIAKFIDHTLLKPDARREEIIKLCEEATKYDFYSVCVNSCNVELCAELLAETNVKITSVVGFPLGAMSMSAKANETYNAITLGASEIDMVMNIGRFKDKDYEYVLRDIMEVKEACGKVVLKVILETSMLDEKEVAKACLLAEQAGADFVKTSTGFLGEGAKSTDVEIMSKTVGSNMGVKASGGIRDYDKALEMIRAGATRIGASSSVEIANDKRSTSESTESKHKM